jgi:hypothetical protein
MSVLSVVKDVCATVGVTIPTALFSNLTGNRTMQEMVSLANEMAQRTAYDGREWTRLKKTNVFNGDGITTAFNLPANYKRMLLTANVWRSTSALQPMRFIPNTDEWMQRRAMTRYAPWGEWTILGGQMLIQPVMGSGVTATFAYMDRNCVSLASGGFGDSFVADGDSFVLDERLLKLGMIWQWKAQKGSPYAEDMGTWADAISNAQGSDQPAPVLAGRQPSSAGTIAYPFPTPSSSDWRWPLS